MTRTNARGIFLVVLMGTTAITGCTGQMVQTATGPMPDYCTNGTGNAAAGAVIGALLGAAAGAAIGGGRGAAIGAGVGAGAGAISGQQMATNCQYYAMNNFMNMMAAQAAQRRAGQTPALASYDYYAPSPQEGQPAVHHEIKQTSNYTDPATKESCGGYSDITYGPNGPAISTSTGHVCTGPDGKPHQA